MDDHLINADIFTSLCEQCSEECLLSKEKKNNNKGAVYISRDKLD